MTHWLYPTNQSSDYHLEDPGTGRPVPVSPAGVLRFIDENPQQVDSWYLSQGYRVMRQDDLIWLYAAGEQVLYAVGQVVDVYVSDEDGYWYADIQWMVDETRFLVARPLRRSDFGQIPQAPVRANEAAAAVLVQWLDTWAEKSAQDRRDDSERFEDGVRVPAEILSRRGQAAFRRRLVAAYNGACAVTGETAEAVLEAAHIQPFSESLSNEVSNGLLLRADIHTLFDLHLIAIDPHGRLEVASELAPSPYAAMAGRQVAVPKLPRDRPLGELLAQHRALFADRRRARTTAEA